MWLRCRDKVSVREARFMEPGALDALQGGQVLGTSPEPIGRVNLAPSPRLLTSLTRPLPITKQCT